MLARMLVSRLALPVAAMAIFLASSVLAQDAVEEVRRCMERNIPQKTSLQTIEFKAKDRIGGERVTRAKIYGKRFDDGLRRVLMRFSKPADIRGAAFLIIEKETHNDMFLYSPEMRRTRRVTAHGAAGSLFGTDFSYEDFERLEGLDKRTRLERGPDTTLGEIPVFVLQSYPTEEIISIYESVTFFIDKTTCVALKTESFEKGGRLRKVLTADPEQVVQTGSIWVAHDLLMRDLRDETETRLIVEEIEVDEEIPDRRFRMAELDRRRD